MILTGNKIKKEIDKGNILISPFKEENLNPNSYDLQLHNKLTIYSGDLDCKKKSLTYNIWIDGGVFLQPNKLYLGRTVEYTESKKYIPMIEGRSSLARLGISIHLTAGFGDIGFCGCWTLEITVVRQVKIYPLMKICQIYFVKPHGKVKKLYNGKYQNSKDIVSSRLYKEYE